MINNTVRRITAVCPDLKTDHGNEVTERGAQWLRNN